MTKLNKVMLITAVVLFVGITLVSGIIKGFQRSYTAMASTNARKTAEKSVRHMGASQYICVWDLHVIKRKIADDDKCGTIQIGMTMDEIEAVLGESHEHSNADTTIVGDLTITYWNFTYAYDHEKRYMLRFDNGILAGVSKY